MFWSSILLLWALVSFMLSCVLVPLLARLAPYIGLMDVARGRKRHAVATPVVGGLAVILAFTLVSVAAGLVTFKHPTFWIGVFVLLLVGVLDDMHEFGPRSKFVFQIGVAMLMSGWGEGTLAHLGDLFGSGRVWLGVLAVPFTIVGVVGVINAINMIDGVDGLSGLLSLITVLALLLVMLLAGRANDALTLALLVGSITGFLVYNLRAPWRARASVFMGDAGTLAIGFIIAWYVVDVAKGTTPLISPVLVPWLLAVPLWDAVTVMIRRFLHRKSPFVGDRTHLHHLLLELGLTPGQATVVIVCIAAIIAVMGLYYLYIVQLPDLRALVLFVLLFVTYTICIELGWWHVRSRF